MTTNHKVMVRKYSLHPLTPLRSESWFTAVIFLPLLQSCLCLPPLLTPLHSKTGFYCSSAPSKRSHSILHINFMLECHFLLPPSKNISCSREKILCLSSSTKAFFTVTVILLLVFIVRAHYTKWCNWIICSLSFQRRYWVHYKNINFFFAFSVYSQACVLSQTTQNQVHFWGLNT